MSTPTRSNNRNTALLESAAELFSTLGYEAATVRNIADKCGMTPGSLYYHYPSKELLLVAVYEEGVRRLKEGVSSTLERISDPWERLQHALSKHIELIVQTSAFPSVLIKVLPSAAPDVAEQLTALRNDYESIFKQIINDLPLPANSDRSLIRLLMIGAVNHVHWWYAPKGKTPDDIATQMTEMVRGLA